MNRNIILILALILVAGVGLYALKSKKDTSTTLERSDSNFKIDDLNSIGRIILTDKEGMRSDLKRNGDHWTVNGTHRARQTNVDNLLKGLNRLQLEHIPTREASKNVLANMAVSAIHVEIFDNGENKLLGYYVGGVTQSERGTYFLKEGSQQPYSLIDPGFDGGLRARYALRPIDWRDVRFWIEETDQIDTLKVHYPKQRQHSFIISRSGSSYSLKPMFTTTPLKQKDSDVRIKSYLTTLSKLACENFITNLEHKDSIIQSVAFMEMDMIYKDESSYLNFYPIGQKEYSTDIPRYFIDYSGKDFMVGQHEVLKGAFRSYEYFFE